MKFFSYLKVELNRIFRSKTVYTTILLMMISPMLGYNVSLNALYKLGQNMRLQTMTGSLIANPCIIGALCGTVLFALLTIIEFDRIRREQTGALMDSIVIKYGEITCYSSSSYC